MISSIAQLFRRHPILSTGFLLALVVCLVFAFRTIAFAVYWADPAHRNQPIAGWMPPRYVAHSWQVPPEVVAQALNLPAEQRGRHMPLEEIAREQGIDMDTLRARLEAAIAAYHASQGRQSDD